MLNNKYHIHLLVLDNLDLDIYKIFRLNFLAFSLKKNFATFVDILIEYFYLCFYHWIKLLKHLRKIYNIYSYMNIMLLIYILFPFLEYLHKIEVSLLFCNLIYISYYVFGLGIINNNDMLPLLSNDYLLFCQYLFLNPKKIFIPPTEMIQESSTWSVQVLLKEKT